MSFLDDKKMVINSTEEAAEVLEYAFKSGYIWSGGRRPNNIDYKSLGKIGALFFYKVEKHITYSSDKFLVAKSNFTELPFESFKKYKSYFIQNFF